MFSLIFSFIFYIIVLIIVKISFNFDTKDYFLYIFVKKAKLNRLPFNVPRGITHQLNTVNVYSEVQDVKDICPSNPSLFICLIDKLIKSNLETQDIMIFCK